jgi:ribosome-associated protein
LVERPTFGDVDIPITRQVTIPEAELEFRTARAGGPGGQGVNTTSSKVELRWNLRDTTALTEPQRARALERLAARLTADGVLILQGSERRSQHRNRAAVVSRLQALVREAITPPRERKPTRRTRAAQERRLQRKRHRAEVKRLRRPPDP